MLIARTIDQVRIHVNAARTDGKRIGFVPTMGYLHEGHLSLIDAARAGGATFTVVSIFVNPIQFGPHEDFDRYPRDEERDRMRLESRAVDLLFAPPVEVLLPSDAMTRVSVGAVAEPLEGARRPGHFEGVATIVAKLFNIVSTDLAVFGQKDAQQCAVIRRMIRDLDIPVEMIVARTMREPDGLAMSSRNAYLSKQERAIAPTLYRALRTGEDQIRNGAQNTADVERRMRELIEQTDGIALDYVRLVDPATFRSPEDFDRELLLVGAVRVGKTRLIDNIPVMVSR
ncbi:MAG TPA: pantoate--beta-alanine ligase [Thermoanaerobaculia bacterium]